MSVPAKQRTTHALKHTIAQHNLFDARDTLSLEVFLHRNEIHLADAQVIGDFFHGLREVGGRLGRNVLEGGRYRIPLQGRAPSLCPATVPLTASASFNGICNR